jgi:hypothetical protein
MGTGTNQHPLVIIALEAKLPHCALLFTAWTSTNDRAFYSQVSDSGFFPLIGSCHVANAFGVCAYSCIGKWHISLLGHLNFLARPFYT